MNNHAWYILPDSCTFVGIYPKNVKYSSPLLIYNISCFTIVLVCWLGYYPWLKRTGSSVETLCLGCDLCQSRLDVLSVDRYSVRFIHPQNCHTWLDYCKWPFYFNFRSYRLHKIEELNHISRNDIMMTYCNVLLREKEMSCL